MNSKLEKINEYVIKTMEELDNTKTGIKIAQLINKTNEIKRR